MSHFFVHVIIPKPKDLKKIADKSYIELAVEPLLAPYDENTQVPAYREKCYCVGQKAQARARKAAEKKVGTIDELRALFKAKYPKEAEANRFSSTHTEEEIERSQELWQKEFIDPFEKAEKDALAKDKTKNAADPKCSDCKGKGRRQSTYNPKSKWDWYQVGGRWTGALSGYDPEKDTSNYEACWLCQGTGVRSDGQFPAQTQQQIPANATWALGPHPRAGKKGWCNGCNGVGKTLTWPTSWPNKGNVADAGEVLSKLKSATQSTPFAVVTPEGDWAEKGEMGWWGVVSNERKKDEWRESVLKIYERYQSGYLVVGVDCHI